MDICLEKLPPNTARVFIMREVEWIETDEICKELTINANNLWVILYRARMALRQYREQNCSPHVHLTLVLPPSPCSAKPSATSFPARTRRDSCPGGKRPP